MQAVRSRVAGVDVAKASLTVCVRVPGAGGRVVEQVRTCPTMSRDLLGLADWLLSQRVELVVMEATGDYWKPVFYVLESVLGPAPESARSDAGQVPVAVEQAAQVWLVNARQVKNVPGRKTDVKDAQWLASLAAHGLVSPSFVPPEPIRRLRDLSRTRTVFTRDRTRLINRLEKVLEDAAVKTSVVLSKVLGVTSRTIIEALIAGERDPAVLATAARGRAIAKYDQLREAVPGRFNDHHAFLCRQLLDQIDACDTRIAALEARIQIEIEPFQAQLRLLVSIPGVSERIAQIIIAETGADMTRFRSAAALASWAGLCPGNNISAGRNLGAATTGGNVWLKAALGDAAATTKRMKGTYLGAYQRRLAHRRGTRRALVATMHKILTATWHMLTTNTPYHDLGPEHWRPTDAQIHRRIQRATQQLAELGIDISSIQPAA